MCLPYGCLKCFVQLEGWLTLLLGILAVVAAIIITVIQTAFDKYLHDLGLADFDSRVVTIIFWSFAGVILLLAISGLCGAKRRSKFLLAIFNIGNICLFLAFISIAIVSYVVGTKFDNEKCAQSQFDFKTIEDLYQQAEQNLCKSSCECYYSQEMNKNVASAVTNYSPKDDKKPINIQQCPGFDKSYNLQASALAWMEEKFECSGWCVGYPIQQFNNVNSKVKNYNNPCYDSMLEYFRSIFTGVGSTLLAIGLAFGIMVLFTCCLCFHPKNSDGGVNYYSKMTYQGYA